MHMKMLQESEVELSVRALQIGEIPGIFNRTITSIAFFESRYLRNKIPPDQKFSWSWSLRICYCVSKVLFSKYALMQRNKKLVWSGVIF